MPTMKLKLELMKKTMAKERNRLNIMSCICLVLLGYNVLTVLRELGVEVEEDIVKILVDYIYIYI